MSIYVPFMYSSKAFECVLVFMVCVVLLREGILNYSFLPWICSVNIFMSNNQWCARFAENVWRARFCGVVLSRFSHFYIAIAYLLYPDSEPIQNVQ